MSKSEFTQEVPSTKRHDPVFHVPVLTKKKQDPIYIKELSKLEAEKSKLVRNISTIKNHMRINHNINNKYLDDYISKVINTKKQKEQYKIEVNRMKRLINSMATHPNYSLNYILPSNYSSEIQKLIESPDEELENLERLYFESLFNKIFSLTNKYKSNAFEKKKLDNYYHDPFYGDHLTRYFNKPEIFIFNPYLYKYVIFSYQVNAIKGVYYNIYNGTIKQLRIKYFLLIITLRSIWLVYTDNTGKFHSYHFIFDRKLKTKTINILKNKSFLENINFDGYIDHYCMKYSHRSINLITPAPILFFLKIATSDQENFDINTIIETYNIFCNSF